MDTPSTPQSRAAAANPTTPSQIPLPSTPIPIAISTPNPATEVPLPETPIPNPPSSIEKLKLAATKIPLPETPTPVAAITERKMDDAYSVPPFSTSEVLEVASSAPTPTPHLPHKPNLSILSSSTPTPEISPLKLGSGSSSNSQPQPQSHLSDSSPPSSSPSLTKSTIREKTTSPGKKHNDE
ncbi:hypothetical protein EAE96_009540 [Botrytis aclada]|nr:hypothetical protein EAE96_009540 [Botrytis aclada]